MRGRLREPQSCHPTEGRGRRAVAVAVGKQDEVRGPKVLFAVGLGIAFAGTATGRATDR